MLTQNIASSSDSKDSLKNEVKTEPTNMSVPTIFESTHLKAETSTSQSENIFKNFLKFLNCVIFGFVSTISNFTFTCGCFTPSCSFLMISANLLSSTSTAFSLLHKPILLHLPSPPYEPAQEMLCRES